MATESDLRDLLRGPEPEGRAAIDLDAVLARARRRRRPKLVAAQALGTVAVVGAVFTGVAIAIPPASESSMTAAEDSAAGTAEEFASSPESAGSDGMALRLAAEACDAPYDAPVATTDLTLLIDPVTTEASTPLAVPVTLRNDGAAPIAGVVSIPRIVLTRDGVVVGHAPLVADAGLPVELAPRETTSFGAEIAPYRCDAALPAAQPADLDLLTPGVYEMRPVAQFVREDGSIAEISGPPQPLVLQ